MMWKPSRRGLFAGAALGVGIVAAELAVPGAAFANIVWGYPFAARSGMSRGYNKGDGEKHYGIDYIPGAGTRIHAVADGVVYENGWDKAYGYGQYVILRHADGFYSLYGHMIQNSQTSLQVGASIARGTYVGQVGNTGHSTGAHLHIELRRNGLSYPDSTVDPYPYINGAPLAGTNSPSEEDNMGNIFDSPIEDWRYTDRSPDSVGDRKNWFGYQFTRVAQACEAIWGIVARLPWMIFEAKIEDWRGTTHGIDPADSSRRSEFGYQFTRMAQMIETMVYGAGATDPKTGRREHQSIADWLWDNRLAPAFDQLSKQISAAQVQSLSDEDLARIATAVNDEAARRASK